MSILFFCSGFIVARSSQVAPSQGRVVCREAEMSLAFNGQLREVARSLCTLRPTSRVLADRRVTKPVARWSSIKMSTKHAAFVSVPEARSTSELSLALADGVSWRAPTSRAGGVCVCVARVRARPCSKVHRRETTTGCERFTIVDASSTMVNDTERPRQVYCN